jgi:hypothetical protein
MLSDHDLEAALRRYRVPDPPGELGPAIVAAASRIEATSRFEWLLGPVAAAAVLAVWFAVQVAMLEEPTDPIRDAEVAMVTEFLGGGEDAAAYAEVVVPQRPMVDPSRVFSEAPWQER